MAEGGCLPSALCPPFCGLFTATCDREALAPNLDPPIEVLRSEPCLDRGLECDLVAGGALGPADQVLVQAARERTGVGAGGMAALGGHHLAADQEVVLDGAAERLAGGGLHHDLY